MNDADSADETRVRRAAVSVGVWVAAASAVLIASGVAVLAAVIVLGSRVESAEHGGSYVGQRLGDGDALVVDVDRVLPWVFGLGILGVIALSLIAWVAARRSVRPLGEALRLQRNFVADASHELRTPLTTLTSRIQIAQRRRERGEDVDETLAQLRRDADTMSDVLTDLLIAAEGRSNPDESTSLAEALDAAVATIQPLAHDSGITVTCSGASGVVRMPRTALVRVLTAVIDNAVQHSPSGAAVTVLVTAGVARTEIRVIDTGPGIDAADRDRIFERFARGVETGRRRGFGLGLALVRDVLARYEGRITIERTSNSGTTFLITLPHRQA